MKLGIDVMKAQRMKSILASEEKMKKIFSEAEIAYATERRDKLESLAGIFSAKESYLKAVGSGIKNLDHLKSIEISHDEKGKPFIIVEGEKKENVLIAISHDGGTVFTQCIITEK